MAIRIKIAETSRELEDVYRLRYKIYHEEEGHFKDAANGMILDVHDAIPDVANIIAYDGDRPVGTIRINRDSAIGLPSEGSFDFSTYREKVRSREQRQGNPPPAFGSAGMLAIAEEWRNRRDVFRALFRMGADVGHSWGVTHVLATVNAATEGIYQRLGWERLADKVWIEEIGNYIVPFVSPIGPMYQWAFGMFRDKADLMEHFSGCFQWYLADAGTTIFEQGQPGDEAYLITHGSVNITRRFDAADKTINLGRLDSGAMFGEMTLIDDTPRSATATAAGNTELIVINRRTFWEKVHENPEYMRDLMKILSDRLRATDDRALIYAHGSLQERLDYFLNAVRGRATPNRKDPAILSATITVEEFAEMCVAGLEDATRYLEGLQARNLIRINRRDITFLESGNT